MISVSTCPSFSEKSSSHYYTDRASAYGKTILFGEHAVVYGVPALAVGLIQGAQAHVRVAKDHGVHRLRIAAWGLDVSEVEDSLLARAFRALLQSAPLPVQETLYLDAITHLPPGSGLGCSAALGVALARAVDPSSSFAQVTARAMAWETVFHGNPSGVDVAIALRGGVLLFEKGKRIQPLQTHALSLAIGHCGETSNTYTMVEQVAALRARDPLFVETCFESIHMLVEQGAQALLHHRLEELGDLMNRNQEILQCLTVSTPKLDHLCALARHAGAFGAKLTGAGGGGCVVALAANPSHAEKICAMWHTHGIDGFVVETPTTPTLTQHMEAYVG